MPRYHPDYREPSFCLRHSEVRRTVGIPQMQNRKENAGIIRYLSAYNAASRFGLHTQRLYPIPGAPLQPSRSDLRYKTALYPKNSEAASKELPPEGFHRPFLSVHGAGSLYFSSSKSFALIVFYQNYPIIILKIYEYCQSF